MVQKLFWQDPYLTSVTAQITSIEEDVVQLERTIFYAESGGRRVMLALSAVSKSSLHKNTQLKYSTN
ncbi:hypothetical protein JCM19231_3189 [Vibrio ishigakensis]|uniref:Uncharacterized protein n=1 Tax=Vibrio ishigakensis TaxID=1481914 RepID=A0A0B8NVX7_9VIBR|nr:hypothetical protein JCM19231_3189 [Vibrio ishigakensis]